MKLEVFEKSHNFVLDIYKIVNKFPQEEKYRLTDQLIRACYSIPANIVEGQNRNTTKDYLNFLYTARGSAYEVQYFLLLAKDLQYLDEILYSKLEEEIVVIIKMLNALIKSLRKV